MRHTYCASILVALRIPLAFSSVIISDDSIILPGIIITDDSIVLPGIVIDDVQVRQILWRKSWTLMHTAEHFIYISYIPNMLKNYIRAPAGILRGVKGRTR